MVHLTGSLPLPHDITEQGALAKDLGSLWEQRRGHGGFTFRLTHPVQLDGGPLERGRLHSGPSAIPALTTTARHQVSSKYTSNVPI